MDVTCTVLLAIKVSLSGHLRPKQNFPIRTGETAFLFLQLFIKRLKAGGRAGVVIKNTFLSNTDNASISLRQHLGELTGLTAMTWLTWLTGLAGLTGLTGLMREEVRRE